MSIIKTAEGVADEIEARMQRITIANGFETDVGASVFMGRRRVENDMIPCVAVIEGADAIEPRPVSTLCDTAQKYVLFAYVPCDPRHPNKAAHKAIRDLKKALFTTNGKPDWTWGRRVLAVRYMGRDIGPRADGAPFVVAAVEVAVGFVEDVANP